MPQLTNDATTVTTDTPPSAIKLIATLHRLQQQLSTTKQSRPQNGGGVGGFNQCIGLQPMESNVNEIPEGTSLRHSWFKKLFKRRSRLDIRKYVFAILQTELWENGMFYLTVVWYVLNDFKTNIKLQLEPETQM